MTETPKFVRIPSLKKVADFQGLTASLGIDLPCEERIVKASESPLARPVAQVLINGKRIGNRYAAQPMEGWDGTTEGGVTEDVLRRWRRFGQSGAKLICGGEAMAVRPDGRANPNQLIISDKTKEGLARLVQELTRAHRERFAATDDLVIGFQLTHSGRFCKPYDKTRLEPRVAYRHPILDRKFGVSSDEQVFRDDELELLVQDYVRAARVAWDLGADFVDIKHCHGYLLHEVLSGFTRVGKYGGTFENRTRLLREIVSAIRDSGNRIELGVRLSAFDSVPYKPDPRLSAPGKPGPGVPEDFSGCLPYKYAFGVNPANPVTIDLTEPRRFLELCSQLGVKIVNLTAGSPYYNPHLQRPAAYPPSDGYQPPEDPLIGVARQIQVTRQLKASAPKDLVIVGSAYSYLQEYLPHVAQYVVRHEWSDLIGLGRMLLAYPEILADALEKGALATKALCRTFSDCTTAPRNGWPSGCYPLDDYYALRPEAQELKRLKTAASPS